MNSFHFDNIDSTNSYLKRNYKNLNSFYFVSASYQSLGHGRYNRNWESEYGKNLLCSMLVKSPLFLSKFEKISICSAVAVLKVLKSLRIKNVSIKWPNDVYINDKKVCGILLEGVANEMMAIGIGLNINQEVFSIDTATSLKLSHKKKKEYNVTKIRDKVKKALQKELNALKKEKSNYLKIARKYNFLSEKMVYATIDDEVQLVKVIDICEDCSLKVNTASSTKYLKSGEVTLQIKSPE